MIKSVRCLLNSYRFCAMSNSLTPALLICFGVFYNVLGHSIDKRVINGINTVPEMFPFATSLLMDNMLCGASLISDRVLLTAAHCLAKQMAVTSFHTVPEGTIRQFLPEGYRHIEPVRIRRYNSTHVVYKFTFFYWEPVKPSDYREAPRAIIGTDELQSKESWQVMSIDLSKDFIIHPGFTNRGDMGFDVALVKLPRSQSCSKQHMPVSLTDVGYTKIPERCPCIGVGWGRWKRKTEDSSASYHPTLQISKLELMPRRNCSAMGVHRSQFCAEWSGYTDTCEGDSGGGLYCFVNDAWSQIGITSWGPSPCAKKGEPGVYTDVNEVRNWIIANVEKLEGKSFADIEASNARCRNRHYKYTQADVAKLPRVDDEH